MVSFILPGSLLSLDTCHGRGGTRYGCDIQSGGTIYSATDGPGGPFLRRDHPRRDKPSLVESSSNPTNCESDETASGLLVLAG